jgi:hypothetical protein
MKDAESTRLLMEIGPEDLDYLKAVAAEHGVGIEVDEEEGFTVVGEIAVLLMGASLAVATVAYLLDQRRGGQVIDLRPAADPIAKRDKGLQHGLVLLIAADGNVTVEVHEPKQMFGVVIDALKDVLKEMVGLPAEEAAEKAKAVVGEKASVALAA